MMSKEAMADALVRKLAVGQRIRQRRIRKKLSQVDLADLLEVSQPKISRMEAGFTEPDHYERLALVRHLGGKASDYRAVE
jgi:transcriptional regulator with XRE-family HTH domain